MGTQLTNTLYVVTNKGGTRMLWMGGQNNNKYKIEPIYECHTKNMKSLGLIIFLLKVLVKFKG